MQAQECQIGAVVYYNKDNYPLIKGKIAGPLTNDTMVIVEWDGGQLDKLNINKLLNEADGVAKNQRLLEDKERLEREFADVEKACADKMHKAAELVREAAALASSKGQDLLDMYDATRELERAMSAAGWRTSSLHC